MTDLVIIGAGPAGMTAAATAAQCGLSVVVLDEQDAPGGQIYRGIQRATPEQLRILGPDYEAGKIIAQTFSDSAVRHIKGAAVWEVSRDRIVNYLHEGRSQAIAARQIILATGAIERPFPIPGWTLPGVLTAGAAQILLKNAATAPSEPAILAGSGPLLYLLGWQYLRAGVPIAALVDTTDAAAYWRALPHFPAALRAWPYLKKGLLMLRELKRGKVPFHTGARDFAIEGDGAAQAFCFTQAGRKHRLPAKVILLHHGVVPNTQITWSLRAAHHWDQAQLCWTPDTDPWGALDLEGFFVAGDGGGIGGAVAAACQGRLAALAAAARLDRISMAQRDRLAAPSQAALTDQLRIRPLLDALYRPADAHRVPADEVIVCRCEEVTAGQIRDFVKIGCRGPNQTKSFGRCGMGPCQGRQCGLTVTEVIAAARGVPPAEVGYYRIRPPIKPITLGELAVAGDPE